MIGAILIFLSWSFDRIEPPFAVLVAPNGHEVDVPLIRLPEGARPGDCLMTPWGPVVGDQRQIEIGLHKRLLKLTEGVAGQSFAL